MTMTTYKLYRKRKTRKKIPKIVLEKLQRRIQEKDWKKQTHLRIWMRRSQQINFRSWKEQLKHHINVKRLKFLDHIVKDNN